MNFTHIATHRISGDKVKVYFNESTGNYHESRGVILEFNGTPWVLECIEDDTTSRTSIELNAIKSQCLVDLIQHLNNHSQAWLKYDGFVWWTEKEILSIADKIKSGEI